MNKFHRKDRKPYIIPMNPITTILPIQNKQINTIKMINTNDKIKSDEIILLGYLQPSKGANTIVCNINIQTIKSGTLKCIQYILDEDAKLIYSAQINSNLSKSTIQTTNFTWLVDNNAVACPIYANIIFSSGEFRILTEKSSIKSIII